MQQAPEFQAMLIEDLGQYFAGLSHGERSAPIEVLNAFLAEQKKDFSRFVLPALFDEHLPGFAPWLRDSGKPYEAPLVLGELAAAEKRLNYIANLARFNVQVWGDPGWRTLESRGVRYRGSAGHLDELTRIYNAAMIHVDIGRIYQPDIVTMRVFDVLACGGFLLAEYSEGLEDLFELGKELICYRTLDELSTLIDYYLKHAAEARVIAQRGKARVQRDHTIQQRLSEMLELMGLNEARRVSVLVG
jgi:spore maturation protein CgeB